MLAWNRRSFTTAVISEEIAFVLSDAERIYSSSWLLCSEEVFCDPQRAKAKTRNLLLMGYVEYTQSGHTRSVLRRSIRRNVLRETHGTEYTRKWASRSRRPEVWSRWRWSPRQKTPPYGKHVRSSLAENRDTSAENLHHPALSNRLWISLLVLQVAVLCPFIVYISSSRHHVELPSGTITGGISFIYYCIVRRGNVYFFNYNDSTVLKIYNT